MLVAGQVLVNDLVTIFSLNAGFLTLAHSVAYFADPGTGTRPSEQHNEHMDDNSPEFV